MIICDQEPSFSWFDVLVYKTYDTEKNCRCGFITEYPSNEYVEKTEVIGAIHHLYESPKPGSITVYMKNGETYSFECWTDSVYSGQYGVNVSPDGKYVYLISDIKGMWCYTYKGELVYKTRYTSASHVFPHDDHTATVVTRTKFLLLDESGQVIKKRSFFYDSWGEKISPTLLSVLTNENVLAIVDAKSLDIIQKISLNKLGIYDCWQQDTAISDEYVVVYGENCTGWVDNQWGGKTRLGDKLMFVISRTDGTVIKRANLEDLGIENAYRTSFKKNEIVIINRDKSTVSVLLE